MVCEACVGVVLYIVTGLYHTISLEKMTGTAKKSYVESYEYVEVYGGM